LHNIIGYIIYCNYELISKITKISFYLHLSQTWFLNSLSDHIMRKNFIILILFLSIPSLLYSQKEKIKWYTIEEAEKLIRDNPRPIFVDTYTDWCVWCKRLDKDTFSNQVIADILSSKYYPVKFNAEGKEKVTFQGKTFINDGKSGASHQLAIALLKGQMSFPTVVFLNEKGQLLTPVPGYRPPKEMEVILSFFAGNVYEKTSFEEFQKTFKGRVK
jgi:thioredoxin-related protein